VVSVGAYTLIFDTLSKDDYSHIPFYYTLGHFFISILRYQGQAVKAGLFFLILLFLGQSLEEVVGCI
jgi:hypothetical protein